MEKKKKHFYSYKPLKDQYEPLLESCKSILEKRGCLVNNSIIYNLGNIYIPNWKYLNSIQKIALFFEYVVDKDWRAFTLRFSNDFIRKCNGVINKPDFTRRRINQNFINRLRYIPKYLFVLEDDGDSFHIHGVIQTQNNLETIKEILKLTAFGVKHRENPIPEGNKVRFKELDDKFGWACYILKRCRANNLNSYTSQEIIKSTREIYKGIWKIFLIIKKSNKLVIHKE